MDSAGVPAAQPRELFTTTAWRTRRVRLESFEKRRSLRVVAVS